MSKNIWDDEPFRDGQPVYENGKWKEPETYAPVPENTIVAARAIQQQAQAEEEFDVEEFVEEAASDEDEDDFTEVLSDARLRLEQGKLYEMVMNHDLFGGVESDPRAAKSVQKQIRKFAKEQMEIMLGMRQEEVAVTNATSDFSSLEVHALKDIAAKLISTRGMKEEDYPEEPTQGTPAPPPKKKTLNTIGNTSRQSKPQPKPIAKKAEPIKRQAKPKVRNDLPKALLCRSPSVALNINRRTFVGSAVASGVLTIVPRHVLGGAGHIAPSEKITMAHIGMGTQGFRELGCLLAEPAAANCRGMRSEHRQQRLRGVGQERPARYDTKIPGKARLESKPKRLPRRPGSGPGSRRCLLRNAAVGGQVPGLFRIRRFSRAVGKRKRPGRGQDHDPRSSACHDRRRGHAEGQARLDAQAAGQSDVRSTAGPRHGP